MFPGQYQEVPWGAPSARTLCPTASALSLAWKSSWGQWSPQRQAWAGLGRSGAWTAWRRSWQSGRGHVSRERAFQEEPWGTLAQFTMQAGPRGRGRGAGSRQGARAWEVRGRADRMGRRRKTTPVLIWKNLTELSSIWEAQGSVPLRLSAAPACTSHPGHEAQPSPQPLPGRGLARPAMQGRELPTPPGTPPP